MAINDLNTNAVVVDSDLIPIWDGVNGRTRNVFASTLKTYTSGNSYTSLKFEGNLLLGYTEEGWQEIGQIPNTTLNLSGGGLSQPAPVSGINFSEEFEVSIDGLTGDLSLKQTPNTIVIDGETTEEIQTGQFLNAATENDVTVLSYNTKIEPWLIEESAATLLDVVTIDSIDQCGIEYLIDFNQSTVASVSFHLFPIAGNGLHIKIKPINLAQTSKPVYVFGNYPDGTAFSYNVTHSTVFSTYNREWRVEESSQLLSVESSDLRSDENVKKPVHGIAIDPDSSLTKEITDEGVLILGGGGGSGGNFLPLSGGTIKGELVINSQVAGRPLTVQKLDGGNLLSAYVGDDNFNIEYYKSIDDYETSSPSFDLINKVYANEYLAKLLTNNNFYGQQKVVNSEFKVEKENGENLFRVNPSNNTVVIKGTVNVSDGDGIKSTIIDSGQQSNLLLKWNAQTRVYIGQYDVTFGKKIIANDGVELPNQTEFNEKDVVTKEYTDNAIQTAIDNNSGGDYIYDGEGFGVPGRTETGFGTIIQTAITGNYRNTSNETGDLTINLRTDEGVTNFRLYYSMPHGTLSARKVYVKVDEKAGLNKTIRAGEIWLCQVKAGRFFDDFFWSKVVDGESTFEAIDVSGFDSDQPEIKPLLKRFSNTDLITIPLTLPEGFSVMVRQVLVRRSSGVELEMGFTYKYDGSNLQVHLNEIGTGFLLAGIIKDEV